MIIRAYLRASTRDQNANRARDSLKQFVESHDARVTTFYVENASGATIERPELVRLLSEAGPGDILLVESVDRLSRLPQPMWESLKDQIRGSGLHVVAVDLPVTHRVLKPAGDGLETWLQDALASMLLDFMAAFARKDYEQRRERQAQGIAIAKKEGRLKPRSPNYDLYRKIIETRRTHSIRDTAKLLQTSKGTVERAQAWHRAQEKRVIRDEGELCFSVEPVGNG